MCSALSFVAPSQARGSGVRGWAVLQVGDRDNHPRPDPWSVADTDLAVDGLLVDFKSTRYTRTLRRPKRGR
jgi:hypothetical protein